MDDEARKLLLLTRIAQQRAQWTHDIDVMRTVATPGHIVSNAVRSVLPSGVERTLFGSTGRRGDHGRATGLGQQLLHVVLVARRYPILLSLAGGLLARRAIRRVLIVASVGVLVGGGVMIARSRR